MRIAVLGAGGAGACTALELADRGFRVDLYEERPAALTQASRNNEGKVHLGLVYAKDPTLRTARTMIRGALRFADCLGRWIDVGVLEAATSTPYYYAVHAKTMASPEDLEGHYRRCQALFEDEVSSSGLAYLGRDRSLVVEKLSRRAHEDLVASDRFLCSFRTSERAVDPRLVADQLGAAIAASPRIDLIARTRVLSAAWNDSGQIEIAFACDGVEFTERYDQVANTLWSGRLEIDAKLGVAPGRSWLHRFKMGGWIHADVPREPLPSLTMALGPFGDVVNYGDRGVYLSWYPTGMVGSSTDLRPPDWEDVLSDAQRHAIVRESWAQLAVHCPGLRTLDLTEHPWSAIGGLIFAWGASDIDRPDSHLHSRYEIGVHSVRNYHSVNTGKYTMVPVLGVETADRIAGRS